MGSAREIAGCGLTAGLSDIGFGVGTFLDDSCTGTGEGETGRGDEMTDEWATDFFFFLLLSFCSELLLGFGLATSDKTDLLGSSDTSANCSTLCSFSGG